ncbi:fructose-specific PTS transporter subunit EIIC [Bacillus sonorensis]|uniref:Fructose-specific phosphotransferase system EIIC component FruA n=2 Tax=Bacillus sonorensis TaxID=119858 RepID=M5PD79_9BACI|nr:MULTISPECIES: PTS fructose transporter subunit IIABC [Bacillus]TWK77892.1 PTS system fructose-specific EIIABC component [Bacillus paralicheniformis]ASB89803.1 Protein-N(pi)-phosphohistidine--sugar phosphotransferase [Bacillus sonorensis]EME74480.1 fructose-specific phosphotransferase system EIIC component FruA [Bacillus sonorensis L12]MBG9916953.1 PTS fructose transporter subunit IIA [Bacillus sonorensis]MCF7619056.1 fructose-specific PTS transporter subunit EIIC [Bacillus sonorensis]
MKITELLTKHTIKLNLESGKKENVIEEMVTVLDQAGKLNDKEGYKEAVINREKQSSTGIGEGIAIPHAKTASVKEPAIAFGRSKEGVDYESLDGQPSHLVFMIAATEGANNTHLEALSRLSTLLMREEIRKQLLEAETEDEIIDIINKHDSDDEEEEQADEPQAPSSKGKILAVTACPTGIAHTFMAADALKEKAKEMGVDIKVETNGSGGIKGALTAQEIEDAVAIIVAADKQVEMERFKGKHVIEVPVTAGIRRPKELIEQALKQDAPIYQGTGGGKAASEDGAGAAKGKGGGFYKHLMSGVSNMLPFVVGGGILVAISFFWGINSAKPGDPSYNEFAAVLNAIGGGNALKLIVAVLAGFIAMSIADRPGFAPGMVGGFMATLADAGFLGGLIAGFLAGYIVVLLKKAFAGLPQVLDGLKPVLIYPLFGIFFTGIIMHYIVNTPVKMIMDGLTHWLESLGTGNLVVMGIILGGMMAIDMGGPINKAAFTFGIAMIDAGNFGPHAAIMAGGMVPPLGIALATTFFRNKFSKRDREAGITCYFMGASFITEGAIPFAAADPARVIPACVIGSAIGGGLSQFFRVTLPAPHGGLFVFLTTNHPLLYLVSVVIGAVVTAVLLGILKKPVPAE